MNEELYNIRISGNDFREREMWAGDFEVIGPFLGDSATEEECKAVLEKVIEHGSRPTRCNTTRFAEWFYTTDFYDEICDAVNRAIDVYIANTTFELLANERNEYGESAIITKEGGVTVIKVMQDNGWIHVIREHEDGTVEDIYE